MDGIDEDDLTWNKAIFFAYELNDGVWDGCDIFFLALLMACSLVTLLVRSWLGRNERLCYAVMIMGFGLDYVEIFLG